MARTLGLKTLSKLLKISCPQIVKWTQLGMPHDVKNNVDIYDLSECRTWIKDLDRVPVKVPSHAKERLAERVSRHVGQSDIQSILRVAVANRQILGSKGNMKYYLATIQGKDCVLAVKHKGDESIVTTVLTMDQWQNRLDGAPSLL